MSNRVEVAMHYLGYVIEQLGHESEQEARSRRHRRNRRRAARTAQQRSRVLRLPGSTLAARLPAHLRTGRRNDGLLRSTDVP